MSGFAQLVKEIDEDLDNFKTEYEPHLTYASERLLWMQTKSLMNFVKVLCCKYDQEENESDGKNPAT